MGHKHNKNHNNHKQDSYENLEDSKDELNEENEENEDANPQDSNLDFKKDGEDSNIQDLLKQKDLKIKELEEKYLRTYADFENTKKRLEREKYQSLEYANESILKDFLPILDTLETALNSIKDFKENAENIKNIKNGIELTVDNFFKALHKNSVELIDTSGEFDPNLHNAIMQIKDENKKDGEISQVVQKGYKYKERIIRPSMVCVTKNN